MNYDREEFIAEYIETLRGRDITNDLQVRYRGVEVPLRLFDSGRDFIAFCSAVDDELQYERPWDSLDAMKAALEDEREYSKTLLHEKKQLWNLLTAAKRKLGTVSEKAVELFDLADDMIDYDDEV